MLGASAYIYLVAAAAVAVATYKCVCRSCLRRQTFRIAVSTRDCNASVSLQLYSQAFLWDLFLLARWFSLLCSRLCYAELQRFVVYNMECNGFWMKMIIIVHFLATIYACNNNTIYHLKNSCYRWVFICVFFTLQLRVRNWFYYIEKSIEKLARVKVATFYIYIKKLDSVNST